MPPRRDVFPVLNALLSHGNIKAHEYNGTVVTDDPPALAVDAIESADYSIEIDVGSDYMNVPLSDSSDRSCLVVEVPCLIEPVGYSAGERTMLDSIDIRDALKQEISLLEAFLASRSEELREQPAVPDIVLEQLSRDCPLGPSLNVLDEHLEMLGEIKRRLSDECTSKLLAMKQSKTYVVMGFGANIANCHLSAPLLGRLTHSFISIARSKVSANESARFKRNDSRCRLTHSVLKRDLLR